MRQIDKDIKTIIFYWNLFPKFSIEMCINIFFIKLEQKKKPQFMIPVALVLWINYSNGIFETCPQRYIYCTHNHAKSACAGAKNLVEFHFL